MTDEIIVRNIREVETVPTSHNVGLKTVLLANNETISDITQIAHTRLLSGEVVTAHVHNDMEECFLFHEGTGVLTIEGNVYNITPGFFFRIPCAHIHEIKADSDLEFVTIGVISRK